MEWRMERQAPFLKSVLQEANQHKRQELLRMANADQINAVSELVMNTLRGTVPRSRQTRPFRQTTTRHYDGSKRGRPLAGTLPML